jgi:peptide/nickel transport system substrate-binding protein
MSPEAARPRYGGVLRVETVGALRSFDPARPAMDPADAEARRSLHPLIFETLAAADGTRRLAPQLALGWTSNADRTEWRFDLRSGVKLHDGTTLDAGRIAAVLRSAEPAWRIEPGPGSVTIALDRPAPDLPWQLASHRYAMAFGRAEGGNPLGTGPFAIAQWEPRRLRLHAYDEHWSGRPFLDSVELEMGRALADQLSSLETGRTHLIELEPIDAARVAQRGFRVSGTHPLDLVVLVFALESGTAPVRRALQLAIDRASIADVLLQGRAVPASTVLPHWLGGDAAPVPLPYDRAAARKLSATAPVTHRTLTMEANDDDALVRAVADRVVVDAAEAGIRIVRATARASADLKLLRIRLEPTTATAAFTQAVLAFGWGARSPGSVLGQGTLDDVYASERAWSDEARVVPLVHVPALYASAAVVQSWRESLVLPSGRWNLASVWLRQQ